MQTPSGGFAYWCGGTETNLWASTLGGSVMILAKEKGAQIPDAAVERLGTWLAEQLRGLAQVKDPGELQSRAAALYTLALTGKCEPAYLTQFYERRAELSQASRSYVALAILAAKGSKEQARELLGMPTGQAGEQSWQWFHYDYESAMRFLAWCQMDPQGEEARLLLEQTLGKRSKRGDWSNTFCNGWMLHALGAYAKGAEKHQPTSLQLAGALNEPLRLDRDSPAKAFDLTLDQPASLSIVGSEGMKTNICLKLTGQPDSPDFAGVSKGYEIQRSYHRLDATGKEEPLGQPRVGDLVRVTLKLRVPNAEYVVVDDSLPSTFEAINPDFASQGAADKEVQAKNRYSRWTCSHQEMRDDRALFFCDRAYAGQYQIDYLARVTGVGEAIAAPAKVEAMYEPQEYGLSANQRVLTRERETQESKTAAR